QEHLVRPEALRIELVEGRKHQQEDSEQRFVARNVKPCDQINEIKGNRGVDPGEQLKRPVRRGKDRKPNCRHPGADWRMFEIPRTWMPTPSEHFQRVRMEVDRRVRDDLKREPEESEAAEQ